MRAAVRLASRVSINLEGPTDAVVRRRPPTRTCRVISCRSSSWPAACRATRASTADHRWPRPPGTTTQFVVGAQGEADRDLLGLASGLTRRGLLHHAHWSAFQPVVGTPMEHVPPVPAAREFRLYQAEHLLRQYGFAFDELVFGGDGNLPLDWDPKTAWALDHPERFPVELTRASRDELLRVPGIGPRAPIASWPYGAAQCARRRRSPPSRASTRRAARTSWRSADAGSRRVRPRSSSGCFPPAGTCRAWCGRRRCRHARTAEPTGVMQRRRWRPR